MKNTSVTPTQRQEHFASAPAWPDPNNSNNLTAQNNQTQPNTPA